MRIRFLIADAYVRGGTARTVISTANALAESHDVEILSLRQHQKETVYPVDPRVRLRALVGMTRRPLRKLSWRTPGLAVRAASQRFRSRMLTPNDYRSRLYNLEHDVRLMRYLRSLDGGVIVGTRPGLNLVVARWVKPSVVRVGQEHMNLSNWRPALQEQFAQYYPRLDALVTLTASDRDAFREFLGPTARVETIPNAVPGLGQARSSSTAKVVVAAGKLTRRKGFDRLVRAWVRVAKEHPDWQLRIYGEGPTRAYLEGLIERKQLTGKVALMGFSRDLPSEMAKASVFALGSRREGMPMVMLEAMGCGLPVAAFDCPTGPAELIDEGVNGYLVADADIKGMARALISLIQDDDRRATMAAAALETAAAYDLAAIAKRWEELFEELGGSGRSA